LFRRRFHHIDEMWRNGGFRPDVVPSTEPRRGLPMKDGMKFRGYAEDCRRLSKNMKPEHKATLLEIADAWDQCAEEAEKEARRDKGGKAK
jgi:hypothetical protein